MRHPIVLEPGTDSPKALLKQTARAATRREFRSTVLVILFLSLTGPLNSQSTFSKTDLLVSPRGELATFWAVKEAGLREDFTATVGNLKVQNISGAPLEGAVFYGEYFDDAGRFCFSLVFSQDQNAGELGPIAEGETRVIDSVGSGLSPVSEPREVRLYLVQLRRAGEKDSLQKWDVPFRAPVTLTTGSDVRISLGPEAGSTKGYAPDLLLAIVSVDKNGTVTDVNVLNAASGGIDSWFRDYARRQATFYPATSAGEPLQSRALVLVRAVPEGGDVQNSLSPRMSPWVLSYVHASSDTALLPVTTITFTRPATQINQLLPGGGMNVIRRPPAPPGIFELSSRDSYWSSPPFTWVWDATAPHHLRRELKISNSR